LLNATTAIVYGPDYGINRPYLNDVQKRSYAWVFHSLHPGGCQFAMADGSVKFISQTVNYLTQCQLAYIHDGQAITGNNL
jgi:prepilin-type processing-associated H-X9-DG protein